MGTVIPFPSSGLDRRPDTATANLSGRLEAATGAVERVLDFLAVVSGIGIAIGVYRLTVTARPAGYANAPVLESAALFAFLFVLLLERHGDYRPYLSLLAVRETERVLRVSAESFLFALPLAYFADAWVPRMLIGLMLVTVPLTLALEKFVLRRIAQSLRSRGYGARKAIILGAGPLGKSIYSLLVRSPKIGLDPVAIVDEEAAFQGVEIHACSYRARPPVRILAGPLSDKLFRNLDASVLVIANPDLAQEETLEIIARAWELGINSYVVSREFLEPGYWLEYAEMDGLMLARFAAEQARTAFEFAKRALDAITAALLLILLAPLLAVVAMLVKLDSSGPVIFRQRRVGLRGQIFAMYKFRTMYIDSAAYAYSPKTGDDSRITPFGRFLRRSCLDEIPQLWNVLVGDMSLVGPRPEMPFIVDRYTPLQRQRLRVKPGITGLWQLSADRNFLIHENIEYDLYYVRNRNLFMDLAILFHTLIFAARGI